MLFSNSSDNSETKTSLIAMDQSPARRWEKEAAKHALDDLFSHTAMYRSSASYFDLLKFIRQFRFYAPFNAMLVHVQLPGSTFVAPAHRWRQEFGRLVRTGERPILILQPMGPVMFVFDVSQTELTENARELPPQVLQPFEAEGALPECRLDQLIENAKRDGIRVLLVPTGSQAAGSIRWVSPATLATQPFKSGIDKKTRQPIYIPVPVQYDLEVSMSLSPEAQYATLAHELAHLYCGHLGTPNPDSWPDRIGLDQATEEFEAESVAYLVCGRAGITSKSEQYLEGYLGNAQEVPAISLDCVLKAAGLIETMSRKKLPPRKARTKGSSL